MIWPPLEGCATPVRDKSEVGREVQALYTNGPAGGGGARKHTEEIIGVVSTLIDRGEVTTRVEIIES